jgi:hypothetical protein
MISGHPTLARLLVLALLASAASAAAQPLRWWKGNLHTHTLWSDGDDFPDVVLAMYKERGYHFVALSDHNTLLVGQRWINPWQMAGGGELLARYRERFGDEWVELSTDAGLTTVRLKTLEECRELLEEPDRFLVLQAEEITDAFAGRPIHFNATNLVDFIPPQGGTSALDVMQRTIDAILEQRRRTGVTILPHLNHPNFRWGIRLSDFLQLRGERFFEIYNGHPAVNNGGWQGDGRGDEAELRARENLDTERMWDIANTLRARQGQPLLYGLAVDDSHHYGEIAPERINPFRGWVVVRAAELSAEALTTALEHGDFYASTGVTLRDLTVTPDRLAIEIATEPGVTYQTRFLGVRRSAADDQAGTAVLAVTHGASAVYEPTGDELFVRAVVTSSRLQENAPVPGELERAWIQPVSPEPGRADRFAAPAPGR